MRFGAKRAGKTIRQAAALSASVLSITVGMQAEAAQRYYGLTGTFSGSVNGVAFENISGYLRSRGIAVPGSETSTTIASLFTLTFSTSTHSYALNDPGVLYINRSENYAAFASDDLTTELVRFTPKPPATFHSLDVRNGSISVNFLESPIAGSVATSGGNLTLTGGTNLSFYAVPEPTTWAMMIGGVGMAGGALRRRKGNVSVRHA